MVAHCRLLRSFPLTGAPAARLVVAIQGVNAKTGPGRFRHVLDQWYPNMVCCWYFQGPVVSVCLGANYTSIRTPIGQYLAAVSFEVVTYAAQVPPHLAASPIKLAFRLVHTFPCLLVRRFWLCCAVLCCAGDMRINQLINEISIYASY